MLKVIDTWRSRHLEMLGGRFYTGFTFLKNR